MYCIIRRRFRPDPLGELSQALYSWIKRLVSNEKGRGAYFYKATGGEGHEGEGITLSHQLKIH